MPVCAGDEGEAEGWIMDAAIAAAHAAASTLAGLPSAAAAALSSQSKYVRAAAMAAAMATAAAAHSAGALPSTFFVGVLALGLFWVWLQPWPLHVVAHLKLAAANVPLCSVLGHAHGMYNDAHQQVFAGYRACCGLFFNCMCCNAGPAAATGFKT
eukprot:318477-Pelagomonas_calceolata.AAC.1